MFKDILDAGLSNSNFAFLDLHLDMKENKSPATGIM
jgi:hypothetical protein